MQEERRWPIRTTARISSLRESSKVSVSTISITHTGCWTLWLPFFFFFPPENWLILPLPKRVLPHPYNFFYAQLWIPVSWARKCDCLGLAHVQYPGWQGKCKREPLGFSTSVTGIGFSLPFNSKDGNIPKYVKYPLQVSFEFCTLTERETDNAVGRQMDASRGNQIGKLFIRFFYTCRLWLFGYIIEIWQF